MTWKRSFLVVANVTATSDELMRALRERAEREPVSFTMVVPAAGGREAGEEKLAEALELLRGAGLSVEGRIGNADPILAVTDVWDPKQYDEIIVSTLPMRFSKWLHAGLPERIGKLTDAPVTHIVSHPARPQPEVAPPPAHPDKAMGPLSVLAWGARKEH